MRAAADVEKAVAECGRLVVYGLGRVFTYTPVGANDTQRM
jgi:hypothetical protein